MNSTPITFWELVYDLRERGQITRTWKRAAIKEHLSGRFAATTINSEPSNYSISKDGDEIGNFVKDGQSPRAWRVGRGQFQLIVDPADDEGTQSEQIRLAMARTEQLRAQKRHDASNHAGIAFCIAGECYCATQIGRIRQRLFHTNSYRSCRIGASGYGRSEHRTEGDGYSA